LSRLICISQSQSNGEPAERVVIGHYCGPPDGEGTDHCFKQEGQVYVFAAPMTLLKGRNTYSGTMQKAKNPEGLVVMERQYESNNL